jgi:hypothetical protein
MRPKWFLYIFTLGLVSCSKIFPPKNEAQINSETSQSQNSSQNSSAALLASVPAVPGASVPKGVILLHSFPKIPDQEGSERFYVTSFANKADDKMHSELMNKKPVVEVLIEGDHKSDGAHYCFSNEGNSVGVDCARPRQISETLSQIKGVQDSGSGKQPLYLSALQFMFKSSEKDSALSKVVFEGASVEKAPLSFQPQTGELNNVPGNKKITISYGASCKLSDENAVGFDSLSPALGKEFYLSGVWSFARTKRKVFAEEQLSQEEDRCSDSDGKSDWYCHLFIDKAHVWYAAIFPLLYKNPTSGEMGVGHRQYPSQIVTSAGVEGIASAEQATFGMYSSSPDVKGFVKTPEIGKVDSNGVLLKDWESTFITGLCLKGYRLEKNNAGEMTKVPFMEAFRAELRSPALKVLR